MKDAGHTTRPWHLCRVLEAEWIYRIAQRILAPGAEADLTAKMRALLGMLPRADRLLDVGCGPQSWLWAIGLCPVGVDLSPNYLGRWDRRGQRAVVASADRLPFPARTFGGVWSIGLLHHLDDPAAALAVREMVRVCRTGGYVAILDAVKPKDPVRRPVAALLRRMDRGRFVRSEDAFRRVLPPTIPFSVEHMSYSIYGLEMLVCTHTAGPGAA